MTCKYNIHVSSIYIHIRWYTCTNINNIMCFVSHGIKINHDFLFKTKKDKMTSIMKSAFPVLISLTQNTSINVL